MKKILFELAILIFFMVGILCFFPVVALADEPETGTNQVFDFATDDMSVDLIYDYSIVSANNTTVTGTNYNYNIAPRTPTINYTGYRGGTVSPDGFQIFDSSTTPSELLLLHLSYITGVDLYGSNYSNAPSMYIKNLKFVNRVELPNVTGMYGVGCDFYVSIVCSQTYLRAGSAYQSSRTITTSALISDEDVDYHYTDNYGHEYSVYYVGNLPYTVNATSGGVTNIMSYNRLHFRAYFYGAIEKDNNILELNFGQYLLDAVGDIVGSGVYANGWTNTNPYYLNAFFEMQGVYYGDVPATPTPSPTPYPGQDTQESINQNVDIIVNILDVSATPVPTPSEIEINPSDLESLEELTLPDVSSTQTTFADLWDIFAPAVPYLTMLAGSLLAVSIFMWILAGRWL